MREEDDESRLVLNLPKMGAYIPQKLTMEWNTMIYRSDSEAPPPLVGCPGDSARLDIWDSNGTVLSTIYPPITLEGTDLACSW